ncbi:hypothetical protein HY030_00895 [Candidatus Gottesmanbacteria bacterium]|nr:hypothetical protein [Candidatus Gottesmanbacteria bacterium]
MDNQALKSSAIASAMSGNWQDALKLNLQILKTDNQNCEVLNRIAQAHKLLGNSKKSIATYKKVLKIDKYNVIAARNVEILKNRHLEEKPATANIQSTNIDIFLEEPGKTKLVSLINLAPASQILSVSPMQKLELSLKRKAVFVSTSDRNAYIGALPDDLSYRLTRFMKAGYKYDCFAKSVEKNSVAVLIREVERSKRLNNQPTFPLGANEHEYLVINAPTETVGQLPSITKSGKPDSFIPQELATSEETEENEDEDD